MTGRWIVTKTRSFVCSYKCSLLRSWFGSWLENDSHIICWWINFSPNTCSMTKLWQCSLVNKCDGSMEVKRCEKFKMFSLLEKYPFTKAYGKNVLNIFCALSDDYTQCRHTSHSLPLLLPWCHKRIQIYMDYKLFDWS